MKNKAFVVLMVVVLLITLLPGAVMAAPKPNADPRNPGGGANMGVGGASGFYRPATTIKYYEVYVRSGAVKPSQGTVSAVARQAGGRALGGAYRYPGSKNWYIMIAVRIKN
jgi:hypothetical protein